jgi:hypothetical protein
MTTVSHVWPGITPFNVWDLRVDVWLMYAAAADDYNQKMREASNG